MSENASRRIKRRDLLGTTLKIATGTAVVGGGTFGYMTLFEPANIDVEVMPLLLPRLEAEFHGYRIAQLSDIHVDNSWMDLARLQYIVNLTNQQRPDLIVITGDFVTRYYSDAPAILAALGGLEARDGVLAILGNHDYWSGADWVRSIIKPLGIQDLTNTYHTIKRRNGATLHLVGIDDLWPKPRLRYPITQNKPALQQITDRMPDKGAAILLAHEPDFADITAANGRFDLQLSGHSHGGQVNVPFIGPPITPALGQKYASGLYHVGSLLQYTNRGLGMVKPQIRFNCQPEITVIQCVSPEAKG
ncbi:MAG: metallophosphoesterase [Ktedonobacteraceae bacterium]|nr:metallophosphoesterase [Ktedonobacteraceae bacterium]